MSATDDIMTAFKTKWAADVPLATSVPAGPKGGKIPAPLSMPYCHILAARSQDQELSTGGQGVHWVRATLTVYGLYAAVNMIVGQIAAAFENAAAGTSKTLAVPNSTHMHTRPEEPGHLEVDPTRKDAEEVWMGIVVYVVMIQRSTP